MTAWPVTMTVRCSNRAAHDDPQEVHKFILNSPEPKGVLLDGARVILDGQRVEPEPDENTFRTFFRTAQETGRLPVVDIEMRCPVPNCVITARVSELGLRRALARLAEHGQTSVELKVIERIVSASS